MNHCYRVNAPLETLQRYFYFETNVQRSGEKWEAAVNYKVDICLSNQIHSHCHLSAHVRESCFNITVFAQRSRYPLTHESADWSINHTCLVELKTF